MNTINFYFLYMKTNHDEIILKVLTMKDGRTSNKRLHKIYEDKYPNILKYLKNRFDDTLERKEIILRMRLKIEKRPICLNCGKPVKFKGYLNEPFSKFCSNKCKGNYEGTKQKIKETCLEKYNVSNISKSKMIKEQKRNSCLKKYGVNCTFQSETIKEKTKDTCKRKYGVEWTSQIEKAKEKSRKTCLKRYGSEYYLTSKDCLEKTVEFSKENYNVDWFTKSEEIKNKNKQTCLYKYGVKSYLKTECCIRKCHSKEAMDKKYNTMKKNNSFNTSKPEEELYLYIKEKFPLTIRQHKDKERYPFCCDFYIPELDLFLELNGTWTHGKHAYNQDSIEDQHILQEWKTKNTRYYDNAIKTWTIKDVEKRETAKRNNLNYKEVWSLKEGKEFIDELYSKSIFN